MSKLFSFISRPELVDAGDVDVWRFQEPPYVEIDLGIIPLDRPGDFWNVLRGTQYSGVELDEDFLADPLLTATYAFGGDS